MHARRDASARQLIHLHETRPSPASDVHLPRAAAGRVTFGVWSALISGIGEVRLSVVITVGWLKLAAPRRVTTVATTSSFRLIIADQPEPLAVDILSSARRGFSLQIDAVFCLSRSCELRCCDKVKDLGVCWNDTFRKIFGYNRWESVTELQYNCHEMPFAYIYDLCK